MPANASTLIALPKARPVEAPDASGLDTSVGKALAVLDAFRGVGSVLGVSQVAERANLPKSTTHRLLNLLVEHGYIERIDVRYRLSLAIFELGNMVSDCRPRSLRAIAMPFMTELYESTHGPVHLAVLDGHDVLIVEKIYGHHGVSLRSRVGGRVPALCTALGKVILGFSSADRIEAALSVPIPRLTQRTIVNPGVLRDILAQVPKTGIAHDSEGSTLGASCLAAPVLAKDSTVLGAVSVSFPTSERISPLALRQLRRSAELIGERVDRQGIPATAL
jgi:DNA-binding IclR family transcriptional regulator